MKINSLLAVGIGCILIFILVGLSHSFATNHPDSDHQLITYNKVLKCGLKAFHSGNYSKATVLFRKAIETKPNSDRAWIFFRQSVLHELAEQGLIKPEVIDSSEFRRQNLPTYSPTKSSPSDPNKAGFLDKEDGGC